MPAIEQVKFFFSLVELSELNGANGIESEGNSGSACSVADCSKPPEKETHNSSRDGGDQNQMCTTSTN